MFTKKLNYRGEGCDILPLKKETMSDMMTDRKKSVCVVGLEPDYSSFKMVNLEKSRERLSSTNYGACYITRSIQKIFGACYVDFKRTGSEDYINRNFELCVISLASHLGPRRKLEEFANFLERLTIRVVFISGGVDAGNAYMPNIELHDSLKKILDVCSKGDHMIGVRGKASAIYLHRQGYKNVLPIGCPTMYANGLDVIPKKCKNLQDFGQVGVAFHWSIVGRIYDRLGQDILIGQDIVDAPLFDGKASVNVIANICRQWGLDKNELKVNLESAVKKSGVYPKTYEDWYKLIGQQSFLYSGRLHATICSLTQGVPSLLFPWDCRTNEIIEHFNIPTISEPDKNLSKLKEVNLEERFEKFSERVYEAFREWHYFLDENNLVEFVDQNHRRCLEYCGKAFCEENDLLFISQNLEPMFPNNYSKKSWLWRGLNRINNLMGK